MIFLLTNSLKLKNTRFVPCYAESTYFSKFEFYLMANINLFHILLSNSFFCVLLVIFTMCIVHVCLVFSSMLTRWSRSTDEIRQKTWENVLINALIPRNENKHCCRIEMINGILKVNIPERSHCFIILQW